MADAACLGVPDQVFFPSYGNAHDAVRYARRWCRVCKVREACLEWALAYGEQGVWGGTTENQRHRMQNANKE